MPDNSEPLIKNAERYHHGNLRAALVEAGLAQLREGGSAEPSLRELARRVGVSANATYRHFADKEALLTALAAEGFRQLAAAQLQAALAADEPVGRFFATGRAYVHFAREHPALFRLMFGRFALANRSEELEVSAGLAYEGLRHGVAAALRLMPDSEDVTVAAMHAWSLVHGLSHLILDGQFAVLGQDEDAMIDRVLLQAGQFGRQLPI